MTIKNMIIALALVAVIASFTISIFFFSRASTYTSPAIEVQRQISAKSINWYTSLPLNDAEAVGNAFTSETGIGVNILRDSALVIREMIMNQISSGKVEADVLTIADVGAYSDLKEKGHLLEYRSPVYEQFSASFKDDGYWAVFAGFGICLAFDENVIDDPPEHWIDLLDPRWQGRIGLEDINTAGSQYGQYFMLRQLLGTDFWKALLGRQKPRIYSQTTDLADALVKGEITVAAEFTTNAVYNYRIKKGTSLQGIYPSEGVPFIVNPVAILAAAQHPDESRIFMNFVLSQQGQRVMQTTNFKYSVVQGIPPLEGLPPLNTLNLLLPENPSLYTQDRTSLIAEFNDFMGNSK